MGNYLNQVIKAIGRENFEALNMSNLPILDVWNLLEIWYVGSPKKFRKLVESGELVPLLKQTYRDALEEACEARLTNLHLTPSECLQVAGLPLTL